MKKVIEFLNENPVQYLATVGRDGKGKSSWRDRGLFRQSAV